jgi:hypothetical protein
MALLSSYSVRKRGVALGISSSPTTPRGLGPKTTTVEVVTMRRTPASAAASKTFRAPSTLIRKNNDGSFAQLLA